MKSRSVDTIMNAHALYADISSYSALNEQLTELYDGMYVRADAMYQEGFGETDFGAQTTVLPLIVGPGADVFRVTIHHKSKSIDVERVDAPFIIKEA